MIKSAFTAAKYWIYLVVAAVAVILIITMLSGCAGCQMAPDVDDYDNRLEYMLVQCWYRNSKNPTACQQLAERYRDWHKEESYKDKLTFCSKPENIPPGWDQDKCRYYLNQK
jgi:hypothetical protein